MTIPGPRPPGRCPRQSHGETGSASIRGPRLAASALGGAVKISSPSPCTAGARGISVSGRDGTLSAAPLP